VSAARSSSCDVGRTPSEQHAAHPSWATWGSGTNILAIMIVRERHDTAVSGAWPRREEDVRRT